MTQLSPPWLFPATEGGICSYKDVSVNVPYTFVCNSPICLPTGGLVYSNKLRYIYTIEYYSAIKRNTIDRNTNRMNVKIMRDCTINFMSLEDIC